MNKEQLQTNNSRFRAELLKAIGELKPQTKPEGQYVWKKSPITYYVSVTNPHFYFDGSGGVITVTTDANIDLSQVDASIFDGVKYPLLDGYYFKYRNDGKLVYYVSGTARYELTYDPVKHQLVDSTGGWAMGASDEFVYEGVKEYLKTNEAETSYLVSDNLTDYLISGMENGYYYELFVGGLEYASWEMISFVAESGSADKIFSIGDSKTITLGSETVIVEIAGFNHDTLENGKKAGITFVTRDCLSTERPYNGANVNGPYASSSAYNYLNNDVYALLPTELKSVLKKALKPTATTGTNSAIQQVPANLWQLSQVEATGSSSSALSGEGSLYPIFTDDNSRIKRINHAVVTWWLRSPHAGNTTWTRYIGVNGTYGGNLSSSYYGVAFGFCV